MDKKYLSFVISSFYLLGSISCNNQKKNNNKEAKPNILIAIADDVTFEHMSIYGCPWVNTPAFDRYIYANERSRGFYNRYMKGEISKQKAGWVNPDDFEKIVSAETK